MTNIEIYEWFLSLKKEGITREQLAIRAKLTEGTIGEFVRKYKLFLSRELNKNDKPYKEPGLKHGTLIALQKAYAEIKAEKDQPTLGDIKLADSSDIGAVPPEVEAKFSDISSIDLSEVGPLWKLYKSAPEEIKEEFDVLHADYLKKKSKGLDVETGQKTQRGAVG